MGKEILKSTMKPAKAQEVLNNLNNHSKQVVAEAYAVITVLTEELKNNLDSSENYMLAAVVKEDCFEVEVKGKKVLIDKAIVDSVSLTKVEKEVIYKDPVKFKDYLEVQIVPSKVKADVLVGRFPDKSFKAVRKDKLNVKVSKKK